MPPITIMVKPVSGACNMRCRYCFYADEMRCRETAVYPQMSLPLLDATIRRVIRSADSAAHFVFQGGEPTLAGLSFYEEVVRLQRRYNARGLRVTNAIQTNGCELSDEMIAFFAREHFLVGVSLDGTDALHDSLRPDVKGGGTAKNVRQTIRRLLAASAEVNVLCVVTRRIAQCPRAVFESLAPYGFIQFIPCLDPIGGAAGEESLSEADYFSFIKATFDLYERAYREGRPVSIRSFDNWVAMLMGMPPENCAMVGRCGPSLVIESDGSVYPCDFYALDEWKLGNIGDDSLRRLLACEREEAFLRASLSVPDPCRACRWYALCRNGCKRERDPQTGANRWCRAHSAFFEYAYKRMERMAREIQAKNNGR